MQSLMLNPAKIIDSIGRHLAKANRTPTQTPFLFIKDGEDYYCLRVSGNAMKDEDIYDDDLVLVKRTAEAKNGDIIIGVIDGKPLLRTYKNFSGRVELHSANQFELPILVTDENDFRVAGVFVGHFSE